MQGILFTIGGLIFIAIVVVGIGLLAPPSSDYYQSEEQTLIGDEQNVII